MAKVKLVNFIKKRYATEDDRPSLRTCQRMCEDGTFVGAFKERGRWYIDMDIHNKYNDIEIRRLG